MKNANKVQIYYCRTLTEATDKANLIYISNPLANTFKHDKTDRVIEIGRETKRGAQTYAILTY